MDSKIGLDSVYRISDDVIFKKIEDQYVIVPLVAGVGNLEDEIFQLNETGSAFWNLIDGGKSLREIIAILCKDYDAPFEEITADIMALGQVLLQKKFIIPTDAE